VDCQDDQLVGLIVGWGLGEEAWLIGTAIFTGDPGADTPWAELRELLAMRFPAADGGAHRIIATLVDSGGHFTDRTYHMTARLRNAGHWCFACKGYAGTRRLVERSKTEKGTARHFMVGVDGIKAALYARLKRVAGTARIHIPTSFDDALCRELTSEALVLERNKWGRIRQMWKLPRGRANEMLDCLTYSYAAMKWSAPTPGALALLCQRADAQRHGGG
jgi:phage terminase large subunit GpA-like protein